LSSPWRARARASSSGETTSTIPSRQAAAAATTLVIDEDEERQLAGPVTDHTFDHRTAISPVVIALLLSGQQQQPMGAAADGCFTQPGLGESTIGKATKRSPGLAGIELTADG
jgi:hypothetical protein